MIELNKTYLDDCLNKLQEIPDNYIDLICVDPPYFNVSKDDYDHIFKTKEQWLIFMYQWTFLVFNKLKQGGSFYVFGGIGIRNGFSFWNYVEEISKKYTFLSYINWRRFRPKSLHSTNRWADAREDIAFFCKGDKPNTFNKQYMNEAGLSNASKKRFADYGIGMICSNIWIDIKEAQLDGKPNRTLEHPDQKPIVLIERIIKASSNENDIILDCFAGSGTTGIACINTNRNYILIEKEEKYYNMINDRINKRITNDKTNS